MLKKLLKTAKTDEVIFPNNPSSSQLLDKSASKATMIQAINNSVSITTMVDLLSKDAQFIQSITTALSEKILTLLEAKYGFEPTDKYKEELKKRKEYINQLDAYLQERKQINQTVESELKQFLNETSLSISKALESFSSAVHQRIYDAETSYGIDAVRKVLLNNDKIK